MRRTPWKEWFRGNLRMIRTWSSMAESWPHCAASCNGCQVNKGWWMSKSWITSRNRWCGLQFGWFIVCFFAGSDHQSLIPLPCMSSMSHASAQAVGEAAPVPAPFRFRIGLTAGGKTHCFRPNALDNQDTMNMKHQSMGQVFKGSFNRIGVNKKCGVIWEAPQWHPFFLFLQTVSTVWYVNVMLF